MMELDNKLEQLKRRLAGTGGIAIAFSGGVDSTFLAAVAFEVLGDRAIAVTALSPTYAEREQVDSARIAEDIGIKNIRIDSNELEIDGFAENPVNRCYYCKKELFQAVKRVAGDYGIDVVADGSNADDTSDYRPGRQAAEECGIISPLLEAGFTKEDIRVCSRRMGLSTAEKPAIACLASRFPYGARITEDKLRTLDSLENCLHDLGFNQLRVRHHGDMVRIEVEPVAIPRMTAPGIREEVVRVARAAGFLYVALDLEGYRTGSMNEGISKERGA